jgi:hemolysin activation/secretion protein
LPMGKDIFSWFKTLLISGGVIFILIHLMFDLSYGQDKSGEILQQLEKKEITPSQMRKVIIQQREEKPKESIDDKKFFIKQITIEGATLLDQHIIKDIIHSALPPVPDAPVTWDKGAFMVNRELTFSEMNQIAGNITEKYRKMGYFLAYAFLPQQKITEGKLEIRVTEGNIGGVKVKGNKHYRTAFIEKHLEKITKDPAPKGDALERALFLLNEYPSLNVKVQLKAGIKPGATDVMIEAKDSFPVSGNLSYDNFGTTTTSKHRLSASLDIGNLATNGDNLMLKGLTALDRVDIDKLSFGKAEYVFPINYNGSKLRVYYANALYQVGEEYTVLDMKGKMDVAGIYITHPLIRKALRKLEVKGGFEYQDLYDYMLGDMRSKDKLRTFTAGMNDDFTDSFYGRNIINVTYYHGVRHFLGGSGQRDSEASRLNADAEFNKYTAEVMRAQKLPGYNHIIFKASGQYSADSLFVAQQFMIGGAWSVRGFRPSSLNGDSGYLFSTEFHLSPVYPETKIFDQKIGDAFKFVLFVDNGGVYKNNIQPGESNDDFLTSLGVGIRLYFSKYASLRLDWAVPDKEGAYNTKNAETYLQVTMGF